MRSDVSQLLATLEAAARGPAREVLPESPRPAVTAAVALRSGSGHDEKPPTPSGSVCDPLTGLADRRVLVERLRASLATEEEPGPAVLLVDLDGFRSVNYSLGWDAGDRLLCEVARRLRSALRDADMVARFGSDEFAVLLDGVDTAAAEDVARRILEEVSEPIELGGLELFPLACIGVAVRAPAHGRAEDLMRDAERALVRARAFGKGRIEVFDPGLDARALTLSQLEVALRRALDNDEFRTHYEPMVSVKGGQVAGFEVLLWRKSSPPAARPR